MGTHATSKLPAWVWICKTLLSGEFRERSFSARVEIHINDQKKRERLYSNIPQGTHISDPYHIYELTKMRCESTVISNLYIV